LTLIIEINMQGVKQTKATNPDTLIISTHFIGIIIYIKSHRLVFVRFLIIKVPKRSERLLVFVVLFVLIIIIFLFLHDHTRGKPQTSEVV